MKNQLISSVKLPLLMVATITYSVHGQVSSWVNPSGGFYENSSSWVPGMIPPPTHDVIMAVAGSYTIGFLGDQTAHDLLIANQVDIDLSSGGPGESIRTYHLTGDASIENSSLTLGDLTQGRRLHVDIGGTLNMEGAKLSLLNGAQLFSLPSLAASNTIEGAGGIASQVEVRGADAAGQASRWESGGAISIGRSGGPASLAVTQGGRVSSNDSILIGADVMADGSSLEVRGTSADGTPSILVSNAFRLGYLSAGGGLSIATAQVADGAYATTGYVQVRKNSKVIIDREDANRNPSRWEARSFDVLGGFVEILGGGHLTSESVNLNRLAIAKVNGVGANGRPSRWDIDGNLRLGSDDGFGSLLIDSGHVTSDTTQIGDGTGSSLFSVEGTPGAIGVWENSGDVFVGGSSTGPESNSDLRLFDEYAHVEIGGTLTIWGPGAVRIHGGEMKVDVVDHTSSGTFEFSAGTLSVNRFDGVLQNVAGILAPGVDGKTGATLIDGNYTQQSGGTLALDIGGTGPGSSHDLVNISGDIQIDGLLELSLVGGFTPNAVDEFTVLAADSLFGFFDNIGTGQRLETVDGRGSFVVNYGLGSAFDEKRIVLSDFEAATTIPGDFDFDGDVDSNDFLTWQRDPSVGSLTDWQANYGAMALATATTAIPEPACGTILGLLAMILCSCVREGRFLEC